MGGDKGHPSPPLSWKDGMAEILLEDKVKLKLGFPPWASDSAVIKALSTLQKLADEYKRLQIQENCW